MLQNLDPLDRFYFCCVTSATTADISGGRPTDCNLLLHLTTKHIFEKFGGVSNCPVAPLVAGRGV